MSTVGNSRQERMDLIHQPKACQSHAIWKALVFSFPSNIFTKGLPITLKTAVKNSAHAYSDLITDASSSLFVCSEAIFIVEITLASLL